MFSKDVHIVNGMVRTKDWDKWDKRTLEGNVIYGSTTPEEAIKILMRETGCEREKAAAIGERWKKHPHYQATDGLPDDVWVFLGEIGAEFGNYTIHQVNAFEPTPEQLTRIRKWIAVKKSLGKAEREDISRVIASMLKQTRDADTCPPHDWKFLKSIAYLNRKTGYYDGEEQRYQCTKCRKMGYRIVGRKNEGDMKDIRRDTRY